MNSWAGDSLYQHSNMNTNRAKIFIHAPSWIQNHGPNVGAAEEDSGRSGSHGHLTSVSRLLLWTLNKICYVGKATGGHPLSICFYLLPLLIPTRQPCELVRWEQQRYKVLKQNGSIFNITYQPREDN
jgi:hypothetical protein